MKTLLLSTALAAGFALPSIAQDAPVSPFQAEAVGPSISASDVIGARIYVSEAAIDTDSYAGIQDGWNDVGEVNDIILGRDGTVDAVLVDIGGFLGIGERQVAVDMSALKIVQDNATDADDWFLVLQTDQATLEGAPEYMTRGAADQAQATDTPVEAIEGDQVAADAVDGTTETMTDTMPATTADGSMTLPEGYVPVERATLTAEMLTGTDVRDANDSSIAEVSDLVLSSDGQVTDVVLDVGGFLGIGAKSVAIPLDSVTIAQADGGALRIWVGMTKDELKALPEHRL